MDYRTMYTEARQHWPKTLVDEATTWLLRELVQVQHPFPPQVQVQDPEYPDEEPVVLSSETPTITQCPCMVDPEEVCIHVVAANMGLLLAEGETTDVTPMPAHQQHEPHSITLSAVTPGGYEALVCFRGFDLPALLRQIQTTEQLWGRAGWQPKHRQVAPQVILSSPAPKNGTPEPSPVPQDQEIPQTSGQRLIFHAETLKGNFIDGKWYWVVFGPDMPRQRAKFGMRIWEEGLATAGIIAHTLRPEQPPSLRGYLAEYVLNDEGKPDKIIRLIKEG